MFPVGAIGVLIWYCKAGTDTTHSPEEMHGFRRQDAFAYSTKEIHSSVARTHNSLTRDAVEMLERLSKLKEDGAITADEYESQKRRLLQ
ncbi:hypothetical protein GCM10011385_28570 [Nitratireductor aestuarii]|uniref:SHOCT domain-containing protein n=2 Tax=Nitratireductor aestuarii TaxID=1735103 RepID=A0A916RW55_9HYPH|nr:hypothetical protein GCM10011385_28570 [Nitratireductor aestuarii]